jgi:hypothetical protein
VIDGIDAMYYSYLNKIIKIFAYGVTEAWPKSLYVIDGIDAMYYTYLYKMIKIFAYVIIFNFGEFRRADGSESPRFSANASFYMARARSS